MLECEGVWIHIPHDVHVMYMTTFLQNYFHLLLIKYLYPFIFLNLTITGNFRCVFKHYIHRYLMKTDWHILFHFFNNNNKLSVILIY